ncbi:hypothetical protein HC744_15445 [Arthrobacter sp. S1_S22]|nr:hypothetical protein [Arthrobacter sp. S1_S22]
MKLYLLRFITYATERVQSQTPDLGTCPSKSVVLSLHGTASGKSDAARICEMANLRFLHYVGLSVLAVATVAVILLYVGQ